MSFKLRYNQIYDLKTTMEIFCTIIIDILKDLHGAVGIKVEFSTFKDESFDFSSFCFMNCADLLGYNWQNFQIYSIEFIKTAPRSWLSKSFQEFSHGMIVNSITAIEDNALFGNCFC